MKTEELRDPGVGLGELCLGLGLGAGGAVALGRKGLHQLGVAGPFDFQLGGQGVGQGVRGGRGGWLAGRFLGVLQGVGDGRGGEVIEDVGVPVSGNVVSQSQFPDVVSYCSLGDAQLRRYFTLRYAHWSTYRQSGTFPGNHREFSRWFPMILPFPVPVFPVFRSPRRRSTSTRRALP